MFQPIICLRQYARVICSSLAIIGLTATLAGADPLARDAAEAGIAGSGSTRSAEFSTRVVNGFPAASGAYPYVTQVVVRGVDGSAGFCGGARIAPRWILTAGHCFGSKSESETKSALVRFSKDVGKKGTFIPIKSIRVHPSYNKPHSTYNDIALLELEQPAEGPFIDVPRAREEPRTRLPVTIVGWGRTDYENEELSDVLREARTQLVSRSECATAHSRLRTAIRRVRPGYVGNGPIDHTRICARVDMTDAPVDSCQGDSGGPLIAKLEARPMAVGIVSYGFRCAAPGIHGVYTNVAAYRGWIEAETGLTDFGDAAKPVLSKPAPTASQAAALAPEDQAPASSDDTQVGADPAPLKPAPAENEVVSSDPEEPAATNDDALDLAALTEIAAQPVWLRLRNGDVARPGDDLVFEIRSIATGLLRIFDVGPDGDVTQIFPNYRTEKGRVETTIDPTRTFVTPRQHHGYRFVAPKRAGERLIFAMVTPRTSQLAFRTQGLVQEKEGGDYVSAVERTFRENCRDVAHCGFGVMSLKVQ